MLISLDHGNRCVKSSHIDPFTTGIVESDTKPPFGDEILRYDGKYYDAEIKPFEKNIFKI